MKGKCEGAKKSERKLLSKRASDQLSFGETQSEAKDIVTDYLGKIEQRRAADTDKGTSEAEVLVIHKQQTESMKALACGIVEEVSFFRNGGGQLTTADVAKIFCSKDETLRLLRESDIIGIHSELMRKLFQMERKSVPSYRRRKSADDPQKDELPMIMCCCINAKLIYPKSVNIVNVAMTLWMISHGLTPTIHDILSKLRILASRSTIHNLLEAMSKRVCPLNEQRYQCAEFFDNLTLTQRKTFQTKDCPGKQFQTVTRVQVPCAYPTTPMEVKLSTDSAEADDWLHDQHLDRDDLAVTIQAIFTRCSDLMGMGHHLGVPVVDQHAPSTEFYILPSIVEKEPPFDYEGSLGNVDQLSRIVEFGWSENYMKSHKQPATFVGGDGQPWFSMWGVKETDQMRFVKLSDTHKSQKQHQITYSADDSAGAKFKGHRRFGA
jgi:hypothetical protein